MAKEPLFYVKGYSVFQRPMSTAAGDKHAQMGFKVCDCNDTVDGAADTVAACLNLASDLSDNKQAFGRGLPHWHKHAKTIMKEEE